MPADSEVGVFELGLRRPGELGPLAEILRPTLGIVTTIGDAHLGFFRDREELAENKWELIARLPRDGLAVLNHDSPLLRRRMGQLERVVNFGIEHEADYRAGEIDDTRLEGLRFALDSPQGRLQMEGRLLGRFNTYNILAAAAAALELGASPEDVREAVAGFHPLPHRMRLQRSPLGLIIDDSYNANPSSTEEALAALAELRTARRKAFVFGDMLELGERAWEAHRGIAAAIAAAGVELVFTLGELARETGRALRERGWGERVRITSNMDELEETLRSRLSGEHNLILVKGSRALELDRLVTSFCPVLTDR